MAEREKAQSWVKKHALGLVVAGGVLGVAAGAGATVDGIRDYYHIKDEVRGQFPGLAEARNRTGVSDQVLEQEKEYQVRVTQQPGYDRSLYQAIGGELVIILAALSAGGYLALNVSNTTPETARNPLR